MVKRTKRRCRNKVTRTKRCPFHSGKKKTSRCWPGYEPVPGKKAYSKGSCRPVRRRFVRCNPQPNGGQIYIANIKAILHYAQHIGEKLKPNAPLPMEWQSDILAKAANALIIVVNSLRFKRPNPENVHYMDYANLQTVIEYGTQLLALLESQTTLHDWMRSKISIVSQWVQDVAISLESYRNE